MVDGAPIGTTPFQIDLELGEHAVALSLEGYEDTTRSVDLGEEGISLIVPLTAAAPARPDMGMVNLFGTTGSTVYVDGRKLGSIPLSTQLTAGLHVFKVVQPDGVSYELSREISFPDADTPVSLPLLP